MAPNGARRYFFHMRRLAFFVLSAAATALGAVAAVPAAALAARTLPGDGSLVVAHGVAPADTPVVAMTLTGTVIGELDSPGRIVIDTGPNGLPAQVTGPGVGAPQAPASDPNGTAQIWRCYGFDGCRFRAVNGTKMHIVVFGSDVNLVAIGTGWAKLAGTPNLPPGSSADGLYWLNGADTGKSLPGVQSDKLTIAANG